MKSLTIIVPIHKFENEDKSLFVRAFESVKMLENAEKNKVTIVGPETVLNEVEKIYNEVGCPQELTKLVNEETDPYVQINKGAYACTTQYFSILEFDDYYSNKWITSVDEYINNPNEEKCSIYLPIVKALNKDNNNIGFINEVAWASSFSDEIGTLDLKCVEAFTDFNLTGAIIKTEDFISVGGIKPSLKIAAWYEFLLRMCGNGKRVFVVPRVGYYHVLGRENSYFMTVKSNLSQEEGEWLLETARQEYLFKEDRNKTWKKKK